MFGPAHSQLHYDYNALINLYGKTRDDAKRREYEEKKEEWKKLQKQHNERKRKWKEEEEEKEMNFQEIIGVVTKN